MYHKPFRELLPILLCLTLAPAAAGAQKVELTPFAAFAFDGEPVDDHHRGFDDFLRIEEGESYGLVLDVAVTRGLHVELFFSRQDTDVGSIGLFSFADAPSGDLEVEYLHAGVLYQWAPGDVRPFVVGTIGATVLDPAAPQLERETRLSLGVGGGVKLLVSDHVGFRFEGRVFATDLDDDGRRCDPYGCYGHGDGASLVQATVGAGLILAF